MTTEIPTRIAGTPKPIDLPAKAARRARWLRRHLIDFIIAFFLVVFAVGLFRTSTETEIVSPGCIRVHETRLIGHRDDITLCGYPAVTVFRG